MANLDFIQKLIGTVVKDGKRRIQPPISPLVTAPAEDVPEVDPRPMAETAPLQGLEGAVVRPPMIDDQSEPATATAPMLTLPPDLLTAQRDLAATVNAPYKDNQIVPILDEKGNPVIDPKTGKPKTKDHYSRGEKALAFLEGWAKNGLFGGIDQARDRHFNERRGRQRQIAEQSQKVGVLADTAKTNAEITLRQNQANTIPIDDANNKLKLAQQAQRDAATLKIRQANYDRLVEAQKKKGVKVEEIDGYLNIINPQTGEVTPVIDPRTGVQAVNPANVTQRTTIDGTSVDMQSGKLGSGLLAADAAKGRQASQQTFTATENEKDRAIRRSEFQSNYNLKVQELKRGLANDAAALAKWKIEEERKVRADLKAKRMTQETADAMIKAIRQ